MNYNFDYNGKLIKVQIERAADGSLSARIDSGDGAPREYAVTRAPAANGGMILTLTSPTHNEKALTYAAAQDDKRFVYVDDAINRGVHITLTVPERDAGRRKRGGAAGAGAGAITAQMPGQVTNVLVSAGDNVTRGQVLLVMEAMKMEIRISAPADGIVRRIAVQQGAVVERGQVLVEVSEA